MITTVNQRMTKMKKMAIALVVILIVLFITGCTKNVDTQTETVKQVSISAPSEDFIDQTAVNPDIGTLDDSPVSDELPQ
jgi:PBP1b-binding outer membrane lipoprotein LpoB